MQLYYVIIEVMNNQQSFISYHIRLQGKIDLGLASWLPELFLVEETDGKALLSGELPDRAALLGVLLRIHNVNYQILSVEIKKFHGCGDSSWKCSKCLTSSFVFCSKFVR